MTRTETQTIPNPNKPSGRDHRNRAERRRELSLARRKHQPSSRSNRKPKRK